VNSPRRPARRDLLLLACILVLGASLRLLWIHSPLLDAHRWRQADTAAIARNLYETRFNVFYPEIDWGGANGYVESEFPLIPAIVALLYKVFGPDDSLGRVVVMVFSTATIVATWLLATELVGAAGGLAAAFLMAASPGAAFFGRTFMPDSPMLFFWVSGVLGFVRYARTGSRRSLWLGSAAGAVAAVVKLPALMMLAPCAGAVWYAKGRSIFRDRAVLFALAIPVLLAAAWYWHAFGLYQRTGLTFGILVQPARTYPPTIAPGPWTTAFSKWSTWQLLTSSDYYLTILARAYALLLLPWGFAGAVLGAVLWKQTGPRIVADLWLGAFIAFVLVMSDANIGHEYYQLPLVPVAAIYFGAFIGPAFEGAGRSIEEWSLPRTVMAGAALLAIGAVGFYYSGVINSHYRPENLDVRALQAGEVVQQTTPADALLVVADDYGATSPLLLYFAHRKGWSFDVENLQPQVIDGLRRMNARFFVSTVWSRVEHDRPEVAAYLQLYRRLPLHGEPRDMAIFDLTARR
jgi:4-amino-4-deoxy-L-arabinose transferase-like glycosyltransferase